MAVAAETTAWRLRQALVADLRALGLPGVNAENIVSHKFPSEINLELPAIVLTGFGEVEEFRDGTTEHRDTDYGVKVLFVTSESGLSQEDEPKLLDWRKRVVDRYQDKRIPGVPGGWPATVKPLAVVAPLAELVRGLGEYMRLGGGLVLRVTIREARG